MQPLHQNIVTPESTQQTLFSYNAASSIAPVKSKKVALDFQGGSITSDAGVVLLRETESKLGLITMLAKCINDPRRSSSITHHTSELLTQRIFQIACGYEDANDSNSLRKDPALKMALGLLPESDHDLASQPTFSRLENMITRQELYRIAVGFVDHFLASYTESPEVIVLDFDDTDDVVHGNQQLALFNGYHQETCYQPLHVYEGFSGKLITTILRPGKRPGGKEIVSYVKRIVERIRQQWPDTCLVYRGDSHYSVPEVFTYLDQQTDCYSVTGLTGNNVLLKHVEILIKPKFLLIKNSNLLQHKQKAEKSTSIYWVQTNQFHSTNLKWCWLSILENHRTFWCGFLSAPVPTASAQLHDKRAETVNG